MMMMMMVCVKRWDYANKQKKNPLMMIQKTPYHNPKNIFFYHKVQTDMDMQKDYYDIVSSFNLSGIFPVASSRV